MAIRVGDKVSIKVQTSSPNYQPTRILYGRGEVVDVEDLNSSVKLYRVKTNAGTFPYTTHEISLIEDPKEEKKTEKIDITTTVELRTKQLDAEFHKPKHEWDYDYILKLVREGVDLGYRNEKGYDFQERAGLALRYDVADLIARSKYSKV